MVSEGKSITGTTVLFSSNSGNCKWKQALSDISLSDVRPPHQFVAKGIKEDMEPGGFFAGLAAAVDGNQEVMAAAFHIKRDFPIVANDDGADVEAVRGYGGDGDGLAMGYDHGTAHTEGIGRGAGGRGNYQPVSLISG